MPRMVREILEQLRSARDIVRYTEVHIEPDALRNVFGPRVFDQSRKRWIEDDEDVIWPREIREKDAELLSPYLSNYRFDFAVNEYWFMTSRDEDDVA